MERLTDFGYINITDAKQVHFAQSYILEKLHNECLLAYECYKAKQEGFIATMHYNEVDRLVLDHMRLQQHAY